MSDKPPGAKVYDRPERKMPSPAILVVILLIVLVGGYFLYRTFFRPAAAQQHTDAAPIRVQTAFWQGIDHAKPDASYRFR